MSDRYTASTITDDALDALYEQLRKAERAANLLADSHRQAERAEAAVARARHIADLIEAGAPWAANHDEIAQRVRAALDGTGQPKESTTP